MAFGYRDRVVSGTVTAGSARAGLPAVNLQTAQPGQVWRTAAGTTTTTLLVDFGASYPIGAVYLGNTNLTASATWRVRLSTADPTGAAGDAYDSTTVSAGADTAYGLAVRVLGSDVTCRYLHVTLTDATLTYIEAGLLRALAVWRPTNNFQFGAVRAYQDYSKRRKGWDGQDWVLRGSRQRGFQFSFIAATTAEWETHGEAITRLQGMTEDVLIVVDTATANTGRDTYFGLLDEVPAWEMGFPGLLSANFRVWHRL